MTCSVSDSQASAVAEEVGHRDEHLPRQDADFLDVFLEQLDVVVEVLDLMDGQPPGDPPADRVALVVREVVPGLVADQDEDLLQLALDLFLRFGDFVPFEVGMPDVAHQLLAHPLDGQNEIDHAGLDGAAGHGIVLGLVLLLGHAHAAGGFDLLEAQGAVGAGAGQE